MSNVNAEQKLSDKEMIYQLEGRPSLKVALPLGLQHVLAMFTGNLAPILLIIGVLGLKDDPISVRMVQCAMFISGLTTLIQLYPIKIGKLQIGAGLPIVMGTSFAFVPTALSVGALYGLPGILGGAMLGSVSEVFMGAFYKYLKRFFPPLVVGSVLVAIGIKLLKVGTDYFAGGGSPVEFKLNQVTNEIEKVGNYNPNYGSLQNIALATLVFVVIIALQRVGKGMWKISAILIGLIVGYIASLLMGVVDITKITEAGLVSLPIPALAVWDYDFNLSAAFSFAMIYVVSGLETIGNTSGITIAGFNRPATEKETSGAILADAVGSAAATLFNALPNTAFGQNAGIVAMTKVVNKWCIAVGAFVLMGAAFIPKIGAVFNTIPPSVLGGAVITVFAMILLNGVKMISKAGFSDRNVIVLAITFGIGLGLGTYPEAVKALSEFTTIFGSATIANVVNKISEFLFKDTVAFVCITAIIANAIFPASAEEKELGLKAVVEE